MKKLSSIFIALSLLCTLSAGEILAKPAKETEVKLVFREDSEENEKGKTLWPFNFSAACCPFSVQSDKQPLLAGKTIILTVKETADVVKICYTDFFARNPIRGLRLGTTAGSYVELPAYEGKILKRVVLTSGGAGANADPAITDTAGNAVEGGSAWTGRKTVGEQHEFVLEGTAENTCYRIVASRDGECSLREIALYYTGVKKAKKAKVSGISVEIPFASETNASGDAAYFLPTPARSEGTSGKTIENSLGTKYGFIMWAEGGFAKLTANKGETIKSLIVNPVGKTKDGDVYGKRGNAWILLPSIEGRTLKMVTVQVLSPIPNPKYTTNGFVNVSSAILDAATGKGSADQSDEYAFAFAKSVDIPLSRPEENTPYYLCFSDAESFNVTKIALKYE